MKIFSVKYILILIIIVSASFLGAREIYSHYSNKKVDHSLYKVEKGIINQELSFDGEIKSNESVDLGFENSGAIKNIYVSVGDNVTKGQLLAEVSTNDKATQLSQTYQDKLVADSQLDQAEQDLKAQKAKLDALKKKGSESDKKVQRALIKQSKYGIDIKQAQLGRSQEAINYASLQLQKSKIYSPIDGTISKLDIDPGETVSPLVPVITVEDQSTLKIEAFVSEIEESQLSVGQVAKLSPDALNGKEYQGRISSIDPSETDNNGVSSYKITFSFDQTDMDLKPGMTVNIKIQTSEKSNVLSVPKSSILREENKNYVMVLNPSGNLEKKEVQTGASDSEGKIEITSGLMDGDEVAQF